MSDVDFPVRSDDLLLSLLGRALDRLPNDEAEAIAEEVGQEYGRAMAEGLTGDALTQGRRSLRSAMQAVADALTAHGFAAHAEGRNNQLRIINNHCPFGDVATEHPVICAVDRGMVKGMLGALVDDDADGPRRHRHRVELRPRRHLLLHRCLIAAASVAIVDVRIGVTQAPREINIELGADADRDDLKARVEAALAGATDVLWITDKRGKDVAIPSAKIAYIELGSADGDRRIGFGD